MTQPVGEPAPGAPVPPTPPAPPAPGAPAPQSTPPGQDPNAPVDVASLPPNVQKLIADIRQEAGGHRQGKTAAEQAATEAKGRLDAVLKALGLNSDGTTATDPEQAAAQLTQRAAQAENAAWGATVKLEVHQRAATLGANPVALLDSVSFVDSLDDLADSNPNSAEFRTALEAKIRDAVVNNPALAASGGQGPARQGADITGSGGGGTGRPTSVAAAIRANFGG